MAGIFLRQSRSAARAAQDARRCRLKKLLWRLVESGISVPGMTVVAIALLTGCNGNSPASGVGQASVPAGMPVSAALVDGSGEQTGWRRFQYDGSGRLARVVTYTGPGDDLQWETADDTIGYWSACSFSGSGEAPRDQSIEYSNVPLAPAARAAWDALSPHDLQCQHGIQQGQDYAATIAEDVYVGAGPDGVWLTGDDEPDVYRYSASQGSSPAFTFTWTPTGAAGSARQRRFSYAPETESPIEVIESSNGAVDFDAWYVWGTTIHWNEYTLRDAGADLTLNTADDTVYFRVVKQFGADGSTAWIHYDSSGENGYVREMPVNGEFGNPIESVTTATATGPDAVWDTDDDVRTVVQYRY